MKDSTRIHRDLLALGALALLVGFVFWAHLRGELTFPWDFQRGYFTRAVARMRDGSFLAPPLWLPWAGFGIPAHLSLQDGTWYLPQWIFDFFGLAYDMVGATRLQVVHVFAAGAGVYVLARRFEYAPAAALVAAAGYVLSASFYSNAQHVDIVRGAALLPWMLAGIYLLLERATAWRLVFCSLAVWQFLAGSYPGIVVTGGYAAALLLLAHLAAGPGTVRVRVPQVAWVGCAALLGLGLAAVKFLPALSDASNLRQSGGSLTLANLPVLTTLALDFDVGFLPHDVTMRDVFIPMPILLLAAVGAGVTGRKVPALVLVVFGLAGLLDVAPLQHVLDRVPFMRTSRFQISDFRPVLHIGLCLWSAAGIDRLINGENRAGMVVRVSAGAMVLGLLLLVGARLGHSPDRVKYVAVLVAIVAVALCVAVFSRHARPVLVRMAVAVSLATLVFHGYDHVQHGGRVWKTERTDAAEIATFGQPLHTLVSANRYDALAWRPKRMVFNTLPAGRAALYDLRYDLGWVGEGFSAFGYEDLKGSAVFQRLYDAAGLPDGSPDRQVLAWLFMPSSVAVLPVGVSLDPARLVDCARDCRFNAGPDAQVHMQQFRENGAVYDVSSSAPFGLVENEPWYPGWHAILCRQQTCHDAIQATPENGLLRRWTVPAGHWRMITYFEPPNWRMAQTITRLSAVLLLLGTLWLAWQNRFPGRNAHGAPQP